MPTNSLSFRIVVFFVGLLAAVLIAAFLVVNAADLRISHDTSAKELRTGERIFHRLLEQRGAQLQQAANVVALDFGFRQAVATGETDTIVSVLQNHGSRIHAQLVMLSSLDNHILADTVRPERRGAAYPFPQLLKQRQDTTAPTDVEWIDGRLYQLVAVPVQAPITIGWVTMGFVIDDNTVHDLAELSGLQVSLLGRAKARWQGFASSLPEDSRNALADALPAHPAVTDRITLAGEDYEYRLSPLGGQEEQAIFGLFTRSVRESLAPFYALQKTLVVLAGIALLVCLAVGLQIARRITGPLVALAGVAQRIQRGDYRQTFETADQSEIGQLSGSLAHMQVAIAEREAEISKLAFQDTLTGLPNRLRFNQLLTEAIANASRTETALAVLLIDLDRFQQINDTLGHPMGDRVLQEVGARLREVIRQEDVVARLSGDEFALFLPGAQVSDAMHTIVRIHHVFDRRFELDGRPLDLRASVGAAGYPEHGSDATELIRCADLAMYRAKRSGQREALYDPSYLTFRQEHLSLLGDLQQAVERDELTLHFQPKVRVANGLAAEAEALVRWIHPERGFVPPSDFIPFAEQTGYIKEVTRWVLAKAVEQAGHWAREGKPIKVSVNLSTRDLKDEHLPVLVGELLSRFELDPTLLCLEITESGFMEDPGHALGILRRLRTLGVGLAIDDYGTGFSSLAYLRQLPITELKIDRAFVLELDHNLSDRMIVQSTIEMAHRLGLKVVAEGVESQAIVDVLASLECDLIQGYFYSKPIPAEAFRRWCDERLAVA
ncbi:MAG: EAL domain-containing protein [Burkholderiales bacterium]|nr:EAL domain-containing protein [Burkholderiales bacterium]